MKYVDQKVAFFAAGLLSGAAVPFAVASLRRQHSFDPGRIPTEPAADSKFRGKWEAGRLYLRDTTEWVPLGV